MDFEKCLIFFVGRHSSVPTVKEVCVGRRSSSSTLRGLHVPESPLYAINTHPTTYLVNDEIEYMTEAKQQAQFLEKKKQQRLRNETLRNIAKQQKRPFFKTLVSPESKMNSSSIEKASKISKESSSSIKTIVNNNTHDSTNKTKLPLKESSGASKNMKSISTSKEIQNSKLAYKIKPLKIIADLQKKKKIKERKKNFEDDYLKSHSK